MLLGAALWAACGPAQAPVNSPAGAIKLEVQASAPLSAGVVRFESEGLSLVADYKPASPGKPTMVLMHGLGAGRGEWAAFASSLSARGFGVLAFDARGHGESGGPNFKTFQSAEAWAAVAGDFHAAKKFLTAAGVDGGSILFGGASVGANLALLAAGEDAQVPVVLLLSPGYEYAGLKLEVLLPRFKGRLLAAAADDDAFAFQSLGWLAERVKAERGSFLKARSGHGAAMFNDAGFVAALLGELERLTSASRGS